MIVEWDMERSGQKFPDQNSNTLILCGIQKYLTDNGLGCARTEHSVMLSKGPLVFAIYVSDEPVFGLLKAHSTRLAYGDILVVVSHREYDDPCHFTSNISNPDGLETLLDRIKDFPADLNMTADTAIRLGLDPAVVKGHRPSQHSNGEQ